MYVVPDPTYMYVCSHHSLCRPSPTQQLKHVLNTVAINQPTWGQLGGLVYIASIYAVFSKLKKIKGVFYVRTCMYHRMLVFMVPGCAHTY
jgi:hypothetical protein